MVRTRPCRCPLPLCSCRRILQEAAAHTLIAAADEFKACMPAWTPPTAGEAGAITVLLSIVVTEPFLALPTRSSFLPVAIALLPIMLWHRWLAMGTP